MGLSAVEPIRRMKKTLERVGLCASRFDQNHKKHNNFIYT